jgi:hypothetical protein
LTIDFYCEETQSELLFYENKRMSYLTSNLLKKQANMMPTVPLVLVSIAMIGIFRSVESSAKAHESLSNEEVNAHHLTLPWRGTR